jgi:hypothetical protein
VTCSDSCGIFRVSSRIAELQGIGLLLVQQLRVSWFRRAYEPCSTMSCSGVGGVNACKSSMQQLTPVVVLMLKVEV